MKLLIKRTNCLQFNQLKYAQKINRFDTYEFKYFYMKTNYLFARKIPVLYNCLTVGLITRCAKKNDRMLYVYEFEAYPYSIAFST